MPAFLALASRATGAIGSEVKIKTFSVWLSLSLAIERLLISNRLRVTGHFRMDQKPSQYGFSATLVTCIVLARTAYLQRRYLVDLLNGLPKYQQAIMNNNTASDYDLRRPANGGQLGQ